MALPFILYSKLYLLFCSIKTVFVLFKLSFTLTLDMIINPLSPVSQNITVILFPSVSLAPLKISLLHYSTDEVPKPSELLILINNMADGEGRFDLEEFKDQLYLCFNGNILSFIINT